MRSFALAFAFVFLVGCLGGGPAGPTPAEVNTTSGEGTGYLLFTAISDAPPENATVVSYNDSRLDGDGLVKRYVERTVANGGETYKFGKDRYDAVKAELSDLPRHDGVDFGYYVRYRGETVRLRLAVEE